MTIEELKLRATAGRCRGYVRVGMAYFYGEGIELYNLLNS